MAATSQLDPITNTPFLLRDWIQEEVCNEARTYQRLTQLPDFQAINTYAWNQDRQMVIPGIPRYLRPFPREYVFDKQDSSKDFSANLNRDILGEVALTPVIEALHQAVYDMRTEGVDVLSDRNNFRKLLKFVRGKPEDDNEEFTILVNVVDRFIFFTRVDKPTEIHGYGHCYEHAVTMGPENLAFYILGTVQLGKTKALLRCESDCYDIPDDYHESEPAAVHYPPSRKCKGISLDYTKEGLFPPMGHPVEVKTKSAASLFKFDILDTRVQMLLSGVKWLLFAQHTRGAFREGELTKLDGTSMELMNLLRRLSFLIDEIVRLIREDTVKSPYANTYQIRMVPRGWKDHRDGKDKPLLVLERLGARSHPPPVTPAIVEHLTKKY